MGNLDYQASYGDWRISMISREYSSVPNTLTHNRMELLLHGKKIPLFGHFLGGLGFQVLPKQHQQWTFTNTFPRTQNPSSGKIHCPCPASQGIFQHLVLVVSYRTWGQNPDGFNYLETALVHCDSSGCCAIALWKGNVELTHPTPLPVPEYRPWVNRMALTANPRSFPSTGKSWQELEQQIQREKP